MIRPPDELEHLAPNSAQIKPLIRLASPKIRAVTFLLFLLTLLFFTVRVVLPATQRPVRGFAAYYVASALLIQGDLGPQAYDNDWFIEQVQTTFGQPISEILTPTLPTVALLALPLTLWSSQTARNIWVWLTLLTLLLTLALLNHTLAQGDDVGHFPALGFILATFALLFPPVAANFHEDQAILFFMALFTLALWGLVHRREGIAGVSLGLALVLKTTGTSLWWLLLVQRRWRALMGGIGTALLVALITLPWIGLDTWGAYFQAVRGVMASPLKAVTAYQTSAGLLTHLFYYDPVWNPHPLLHWPLLASALSMVITVGALGVTLWLGRSATTLDFFAALVPLSVILLPIAEVHHFVVMLISIFILVTAWLKQPPPGGLWAGEWWLLGGALILLIAPIPYENFSFRPGGWVWLAYPRLYGGWLLWAAAVRWMRVRPSHQRS